MDGCFDEAPRVSGKLAVTDPKPLAVRLIDDLQGIALLDGGADRLEASQEAYAPQSWERFLAALPQLYLWRNGSIPSAALFRSANSVKCTLIECGALRNALLRNCARNRTVVSVRPSPPKTVWRDGLKITKG